MIIAGFGSSTIVAILGIILRSMNTTTVPTVGYLMWLISAPLILVLCCLLSWGRILRARLLGRSGHSFHWSLYEPPLRRIAEYPTLAFPPRMLFAIFAINVARRQDAGAGLERRVSEPAE